MAFGSSWIYALLGIILGGGVRDLGSCISTEAYWRVKSVAVSFDQLTHELEPVKAADTSRFIGDLDADDPKTRDEAAAKILELGPSAIAALQEATKNTSPEVAQRATGLLAAIRASSKSRAVRRLMAIRTLGELKDAKALPILKPLLESKEMFEADYAKAAIAKIDGKSFVLPPATDADRAIDVGLLSSQVDLVAQIAPGISTDLFLDKLIDQIPTVDVAHRTAARDRTVASIVQFLDTIGDVRLDVVTMGYYAAPVGQPAVFTIVGRGQFDAAAVTAALIKEYPKFHQVNGCTAIELDDGINVLIASDRRIALVFKEDESQADLEPLSQAMKKGAGDFANNADLGKLLKTIDLKQPIWLAIKMPPGVAQFWGPIGQFKTMTVVGRQSLDKQNKLMTDLSAEAEAPDAGTAQSIVGDFNQELQNAVRSGRRQQARQPMIKPIVDFADSIKATTNGAKASATGSMHEMEIISVMAIPEVSVLMSQPATR